VSGKSEKLSEETKYALLKGEEKDNALNSPEVARDGLINLKYDIWYCLNNFIKKI
jgi:hypothetical protein